MSLRGVHPTKQSQTPIIVKARLFRETPTMTNIGKELFPMKRFTHIFLAGLILSLSFAIPVATHAQYKRQWQIKTTKVGTQWTFESDSGHIFIEASDRHDFEIIFSGGFERPGFWYTILSTDSVKTTTYRGSKIKKEEDGFEESPIKIEDSPIEVQNAAEPLKLFCFETNWLPVSKWVRELLTQAGVSKQDSPKKTWSMSKDSSWFAYAPDSTTITIQKAEVGSLIVEGGRWFSRSGYNTIRFIVTKTGSVSSYLFDRERQRADGLMDIMPVLNPSYDIDRAAPFLDGFCREQPKNKLLLQIQILLQRRTPPEPLLLPLPR